MPEEKRGLKERFLIGEKEKFGARNSKKADQGELFSGGGNE